MQPLSTRPLYPVNIQDIVSLFILRVFGLQLLCNFFIIKMLYILQIVFKLNNWNKIARFFFVVSMHFTSLISCKLGHDGYNGMNIQNEMMLEKNGYFEAKVARTISSVWSRSPWIHNAKSFVEYLWIILTIRRIKFVCLKGRSMVLIIKIKNKLKLPNIALKTLEVTWYDLCPNFKI